MAARQDQTLQIALIFFVITTIGMLCFLVYVNRLRADHMQRAETLEEEKRAETTKANNLQNQNQQYRLNIGMGEFDSPEEVQKQFEQDMAEFAAGFPPTDQVYRRVVARLYDENTRSAEQETQAKQREKELKARLLALEAEKDAQIKKYAAELKTAESDAASERNKFNQARADLEDKREQLVEAMNRQRAEYDKQLEELNMKISDLEGELAKVTKSREKLLAERTLEDPSFEISDGHISWVNQANRTVWINLGTADSLRRQVTFSVYEQSESDAGKATKKASIEVIRLLGDHMAEARITDDDPRNPILPQDWIYSPAWHRGKKIHFALTGELDLDGDGRADLQQAKDLIALNGGVVDAAVTEKGDYEGEMTVETRYLVLGEYPRRASQSELITSWEEMTREAQSLGVETITLQEFLNQMGYKPLDRTVVLGDGSRASDFIPKPSKFRSRTPYATP